MVSELNAAELSDSFLDLGSLSLMAKCRNNLGRKAKSRGKGIAAEAHLTDACNDDVLFIGTNIKVKSDVDYEEVQDYLKDEDRNDVGAAGQKGPLNDARRYSPDEMEWEDLPSVDFDDRFSIRGVDYHQKEHAGHSSAMDPAVGQIEDVTDAAKEQVEDMDRGTAVDNATGNKPETGFLLNLFRGKGAKATLKSIVKGKPVYNKIIDLDDCANASYAYGEVHDAIRQVASSRKNFNKAESHCSAMSNGSNSPGRRRGSYRKEPFHPGYNGQLVNPSPQIMGLGRMDPVHMGRFDFRNPSADNRHTNVDKQHMTPDLFNGWIRVIFNVVVTAVLLYLGLVFILAVSRDIGNGLEKRRQMVKAEARLCQDLYNKNKCRTVDVPALEHQCREWEACMYRDAILYDDASFLSAEVLGGVLNKFVSQLDARTVGIVIAAFLALFVGSNCALSMSSGPRAPSQGWFKGWLTRSNAPPNGSDILPNGQYTPSPEILQAMRNPYLQPNYCVMGSYPYVNMGGYAPMNSYSSLGYYHDQQNSEAETTGRNGRISAWKRRFMSPWVDQ